MFSYNAIPTSSVMVFRVVFYDELECRSFLVFGLKTAAFWTLTDHRIWVYSGLWRPFFFPSKE